MTTSTKFRLYKYLLFCTTALLPLLHQAHAIRSPEAQVGQICHTQPEQATHNYAGLWEFNTFGRLVCNYWQFLGTKERRKIESGLGVDGEPRNSYIDAQEQEEPYDNEDGDSLEPEQPLPEEEYGENIDTEKKLK